MLQTPDKDTKTLLDLAGYMENTVRNDQYRQEVYNDGCGRGCIAYWFSQMKLGTNVPFADIHYHMGIERNVADQLFSPEGGKVTLMGIGLRGPSVREAAKCLRHLAVTGEVPANWTRFIPEGASTYQCREMAPAE